MDNNKTLNGYMVGMAIKEGKQKKRRRKIFFHRLEILTVLFGLCFLTFLIVEYIFILQNQFNL